MAFVLPVRKRRKKGTVRISGAHASLLEASSRETHRIPTVRLPLLTGGCVGFVCLTRLSTPPATSIRRRPLHRLLQALISISCTTRTAGHLTRVQAPLTITLPLPTLQRLIPTTLISRRSHRAISPCRIYRPSLSTVNACKRPPRLLL